MLLQQILSALIACLGYCALLIAAGVFSGRRYKGMFVYYTNLSNLLVCTYHTLLLGASFAPAGRLYRLLTVPPLAMAMAVCISVTGIIYHFILVPYYKKNKLDFDGKFWSFSNITVHYAIPLLSVLAWALCADKQLTVLAAVYWLVLPVAYTAFAVLRGRFGGTIDGTPDGLRYPYPFVDLDALGARGMARNLVVYTAAFFLLGLAFVALGRLLALVGV